ncbi:MAG: potassium channel protein [Candidatus Hydrogenedentota bacterium]
MDALKKFKLSILLLIIVILIGSSGYIIIEGWNYYDAIYMTIITIFSVGYAEIHPLSFYGRIFTIVLILCGISALTFSIANLTAFIVEGDLHKILRRRKMEKRLQDIKNHIIVCGVGRVGYYAVSELSRINIPVVIIDTNQDNLSRAETNFSSIIALYGNATEEKTLIDAGVKLARGLIATLSTDADNLFLLVTAKALNPNLPVIARAIDDKAIDKFKRAGADKVVSPNVLGGLRMASIAVRPTVVNFLDTMIYSEEEVLRLEEVTIPVNSSFIGKTLAQVQIPNQTGLIIIAIKDISRGGYVYNPKSDTLLTSDSILIVMGSIGQIQRLRDLVLK